MRFPGTFFRWTVVTAVMVTILSASVWFGLDWLAKKPDVDVVNRYLAAYQHPDLETVKSLVSADMIGVLPGDQRAFAQAVAQAPNGRIKSWRVKSVERNGWVGQSIIAVDVTTTKKTFNLAFDVFNLPEGRVVRAVSDLDLPVATDSNQAIMPSMGATSSGHGP